MYMVLGTWVEETAANHRTMHTRTKTHTPSSPPVLQESCEEEGATGTEGATGLGGCDMALLNFNEFFQI